MKFPAKLLSSPVLIILPVLSAFWLIISFRSEGGTDFADSLIHYRIAMQAFQQPELFLDLWGKPLFTILCAPFAQLGYDGAKLFNFLLIILTAWFGYKAAIQLNIRYAYLFPVFLMFFPVYAVTMISSLTEILFALVLMVAVFLFLRKNFIWSAVVISLIPFARTEGYGILAAFAFILLLNRQFRSLPFLLTGTLLFSLAGWNYHHDFFWVFTKIPYSSANTIYGTGELLFYWKESGQIIGTPLKYLILAGSVFILYNIFRAFRTDRLQFTPSLNEMMLVWMLFFGYILFQSVIWYKGIMAVLGSHRFISSVAPLGALIALRGFNDLIRLLEFKKWLALPVAAVVLFYVIQRPFMLYQFPIELDQKGKVLKETAEWLKNSVYKDRKVFYSDPFWFHFLGINPYDKTKSEELVPAKIGFEQYIPNGSILLWDAHFSANEGQLPESRITGSPHFNLLKSVYPVQAFKVLGDKDYAIHILEKIVPASSEEFKGTLLNTANYFKTSSGNLKPVLFADFNGEIAPPQLPLVEIINEPYKDNAVVLNPANPYLLVAEGKLATLPFSGNRLIYHCLNLESENFDPGKDNFLLIINVSRNDEMIYFAETNLKDLLKPAQGFYDVFAANTFPVGLQSGDDLKMFFYYPGANGISVNYQFCAISIN